LKISPGANPGYGAALPAAKFSEEISRIRGMPIGEDWPFSVEPLMIFDANRRDGIHPRDHLSAGRPTGFKLCVGHPWECLCVQGNAQGFFTESGVYDHLHKVVDRFDDVANKLPNKLQGVGIEHVRSKAWISQRSDCRFWPSLSRSRCCSTFATDCMTPPIPSPPSWRRGC
jgi:hypothetical protein